MALTKQQQQVGAVKCVVYLKSWRMKGGIEQAND